MGLKGVTVVIDLEKLQDFLNENLMGKGEFRDLIGISQQTMSKINRGLNVSIDTLKRVAYVLKVPPKTLVKSYVESDIAYKGADRYIKMLHKNTEEQENANEESGILGDVVNH